MVDLNTVRSSWLARCVKGPSTSSAVQPIVQPPRPNAKVSSSLERHIRLAHSLLK